MIHTVLAERSRVSIGARGRTLKAISGMTRAISITGASMGTTNGRRRTDLVNFQPICYYLAKK